MTSSLTQCMLVPLHMCAFSIMFCLICFYFPYISITVCLRAEASITTPTTALTNNFIAVHIFSGFKIAQFLWLFFITCTLFHNLTPCSKKCNTKQQQHWEIIFLLTCSHCTRRQQQSVKECSAKGNRHERLMNDNCDLVKKKTYFTTSPWNAKGKMKVYVCQAFVQYQQYFCDDR